MEFSPPRRKRNGAAFFCRHEGIGPYNVRFRAVELKKEPAGGTGGKGGSLILFM